MSLGVWEGQSQQILSAQDNQKDNYFVRFTDLIEVNLIKEVTPFLRFILSPNNNNNKIFLKKEKIDKKNYDKFTS